MLSPSAMASFFACVASTTSSMPSITFAASSAARSALLANNRASRSPAASCQPRTASSNASSRTRRCAAAAASASTRFSIAITRSRSCFAASASALANSFQYSRSSCALNAAACISLISSSRFK